MPEPEPQTPPEQSTDAPTIEGPFDADRASRTIAALRAEVREVRSALATAQADAAASSSAMSAAEERAVTAERTLYVERARIAHNLPEDVVEFLTGDTEEEIKAKAERLARLGKATAPQPEPAPVEPQPSPVTRPEPALVPGHGLHPPDTFDPRTVAAAARTIGEAR